MRCGTPQKPNSEKIKMKIKGETCEAFLEEFLVGDESSKGSHFIQDPNYQKCLDILVDYPNGKFPGSALEMESVSLDAKMKFYNAIYKIPRIANEFRTEKYMIDFDQYLKLGSLKKIKIERSALVTPLKTLKILRN